METRELLKIVRHITELNQKSEFSLTGSLMLKLIGLDLVGKTDRKRIGDIDFTSKEFGFIPKFTMPEGFKKIAHTRDSDGYIDTIQYYNEKLKLKVDIIWSDELGEDIEINGHTYSLGSVEKLLKQKIKYIERSKVTEVIEKHKKDIEIIEKWRNEKS